jgi:pheromone a factor receptor
LWCVAIVLIYQFNSTILSVMSLRALFQRQAQFNQFLVSNKSITISRYVRLMALAMMDIIFTVPIATFALVLNCLNGLDPYINWANIHYDFSRVEQIPSVMWRLKTVEILSLELTRWSGPFCALLFFAFFGFAEEARRNYAIVGRALLSPFTAVARALGSRLPSSYVDVSASFLMY